MIIVVTAEVESPLIIFTVYVNSLSYFLTYNRLQDPGNRTVLLLEEQR